MSETVSTPRQLAVEILEGIRQAPHESVVDTVEEILTKSGGSSAGVSRKTVAIIHHFDPTGRYFILALCEDGSLWKLHGLYEGTPTWEPFPVPQG